VRRLSLLQTERQLNSAIECFASHGDGSLINYLDFCQACTRAEARGRAVDHEGSSGHGYGSGSLGSSETRDRNDRSFVFGSGYDGVASRSRDWGSGGGTWSEESRDAYVGRTSSLSSSGRPPLSRGAIGTNSSIMLGRGSLSGGVSQAARDSWACSVCMYSDNPLLSATKCLVCDTPDYSKKNRGGSGCRNCHFQNEFDARECAMCGLTV